MVLLGDDALVRSQNQLSLVHIDMKSAQDEDQPRERSVRGDRLQPLIVQVEQDHLRFRSPKNHITQLLYLHGRLERQLELRGTNGDVGEVEQVHLKGIQ